ncbi:MAG: DUF6265 family protein [Cyclobacteriaceae bacterium]
MKKHSITVLLILLTTSLTFGQDKVSIEDFAWLSGHWIGDGFGGVSEEIWGEPMAGTMVGLFRHLNDGKPNFAEFFQINEEGDSIRFRLKHFNPDMTGWETKEDYVEFPFISVEPGKAVFKGLTYELVSENQMVVTLKLRNKERQWEEVFTFNRSEPFPKASGD